MPEPTPAQTAILDQLEATAADLRDYIYGLDAPDLMAEIRCAFGRLIPGLLEEHGTGHPLTITAVAVSQAVSRLDADGADNGDGTVNERHTVIPGAIKASEECRCATPDGGMRGRINHLHDSRTSSCTTATDHPPT